MKLPVFVLLAGCLGWSQSPSFEVATVKPAEMPGPGRGGVRFGPSGGPGTSDPGRIHYVLMTLRDLLRFAYNVKPYQISGPDWLDGQRFDVTATMPPDTSKERFRFMLQNLLAERFKMAIHHDTKELPMYSLVVAKGGPKMKESTDAPAPPLDSTNPPPPGSPPLATRSGLLTMFLTGHDRTIAHQQTMQDVANWLSVEVGRPVTDNTGLTAKYDFTVTYSREGLEARRLPMAGMPVTVALPPPGAAPAPAPASDSDAANLFQALQSQLGLRLEAKKGPVDVIVVDHAEKTPTEN